MFLCENEKVFLNIGCMKRTNRTNPGAGRVMEESLTHKQRVSHFFCVCLTGATKMCSLVRRRHTQGSLFL